MSVVVGSATSGAGGRLVLAAGESMATFKMLAHGFDIDRLMSQIGR